MKQFITNADGEKICVVVEGPENKKNKKLVFLQHGWSGYKEQTAIRVSAQAFLAAGYVVVSFDSRNSFGESDGLLENTRLTGFIEDLSTVIEWSRSQDFYAEPFALCGHSLGGGSILHYAEENPSRVSLLVPVSAMVGGKYFERSRLLNFAEAYERWRLAGVLYRERKDNPRINGYISFATVDDMLKYDMVAAAGKIACPVLLVTGDGDLSSTLYNNEQLLSKIETDKTLKVIAGCAHNFDSPSNQKDLYEAVFTWLSGHRR